MAKGYRALKFDPFGAGYYELEPAEKRRVVSLVEAVRDAVGPDVEILLEMHGRFNPVTAIAMVKELVQFDLGWVKESALGLPEVVDAILRCHRVLASASCSMRM